MLPSVLLLLLCLPTCMMLEFPSMDSVIEAIYNGLIAYEESSTEHALLKKALKYLKLPTNLFKKNILSSIASTGVCIACAGTLKYFIERSRLGFSRDRLVKGLVYACTLMNLSTERVCKGGIELNVDTLIYIVRENKNLDSYKACSIVCQNFGCFKKYRTEWSVNLPDGISPERFTNATSGNYYRILQITDLHMDPLYEVGGKTECGEPLCCQMDQGPASNVETGARKWGDYRDCDAPYSALDDLIAQIKKHNNNLEPNFSYFYFTGDIISHRVWNTSRESNTQEIKRIYKLFKDNFNEIQIYPILGNHEPHPLDVFSPLSVPTNKSTTWIFDLVAEEWADWLPSESLDTIRQGGYYTVLVKPGFRIIGLNSNVCYIFNWWLLYDNVDPFDQLSWLIEVLLAAEENDESVHILSHVPPGDSTCLQEWTRQYRRIVQRFANTITGQFNGHTHYDEFRVFYDNSTSKVINVAYNGGSFTTFNNLNPNYRFYDVDADTQELIDFEQWTYDLTQANENSKSSPNWYKLYNFRSAYNVNSLKPRDVELLVNNMNEKNDLLEKYFRFKVREAKPSLLQGCKSDCHKLNLCTIKSMEADEAAACSK